MDGYDRAMTDGRTETHGQKYGRTETDITDTQAQFKLQAERRGGCPVTITGAQLNKYSLTVDAVI